MDTRSLPGPCESPRSSISVQCDLLHACGYRCKVGRAFLKTFSPAVFSATRDDNELVEHEFSFGVYEPPDTTPAWVARYEQYLQTKLCPVGTAYDGTILCVGDVFEFRMLCCCRLGALGRNGSESLRRRSKHAEGGARGRHAGCSGEHEVRKTLRNPVRRRTGTGRLVPQRMMVVRTAAQ